MIDSSQQHPTTPETVVQPVEELNTHASKKANKSLPFIVGALLLLFVICICTILCMAAGGTTFIKIAQEREPVTEVIDSFMQTMVQKDTQTAFELFSSRAQRQIKIDDLEKMLEGNNYILFEGYQALEIQNLNITKGFNTNQDIAQGTVAKVDGIISYDGGFTGSFDAVLEKEGDIWRLHQINVTVPPDKFTP